jgi:superfamily I DNA/RNA helicase
VVLVDTVNAGRPFAPAELTALLNVAASRAREYLFVLSSRDEAHAQVPWRLLSQLTPILVDCPAGGPLRWAEVRVRPRRRVATRAPARSVAEEVAAWRAGAPLATHEQRALSERRFDEGHHLVRGAAGSGKTYVLVRWAARYLREHPHGRVLVTFFNRSLAPLLRALLGEALRELPAGGDGEGLLARAVIQHADGVVLEPQSYDAVFVDEAQDLDAGRLASLYAAVRPVRRRGDGALARPLFLFADDSQNIYGRSTLEELRGALPEELSFSGRVRVLRESFRSTCQVLELAFNVLLDPLSLHPGASPGMREFMRAHELVEQRLLEAPRAPGELYRVGLTEREGTLPVVRGFPSLAAEQDWLVREVRRVLAEGVQPGDILVVALCSTHRYAGALREAGLPAVAYGGRQGAEPERFPAQGADHVRITTIMSSKGHEAPFVFFVGLDDLDDIGWLMEGRARNDARETERTRRSLFYVAATRATLRQYLSGRDTGRFVQVADAYARRLEGVRVTDVA